MYISKSQAARKAVKSGLTVFETAPVRHATGCVSWVFQKRNETAASKYAVVYASTRDWIRHTEVTRSGKAILVVNLPQNELPVGIPAMFLIKPITPELWEPQRQRRAIAIAST